jgi:hypothetical protein
MGVIAEPAALRGLNRRSHPRPCPSPIEGEGIQNEEQTR